MAGTMAGGKKAAKKNIEKDPQFYAKIGAKGGKLGHTGGFAANRELARTAGAIGGRRSRRTAITPKVAKIRSDEELANIYATAQARKEQI